MRRRDIFSSFLNSLGYNRKLKAIDNVDDLIRFALAYRFQNEMIIIEIPAMEMRNRIGKNEKCYNPINSSNTVRINIGCDDYKHIIDVKSSKESIDAIKGYIDTRFDWIRNIYGTFSMVPSVDKIEENIDGLKHVFDFKCGLIRSLMYAFAEFSNNISFMCDDYILDAHMIENCKFTDENCKYFLKKTHVISILIHKDKEWCIDYVEVFLMCVCEIFNNTRENKKSTKIAMNDECVIEYGTVLFKICVGEVRKMRKNKLLASCYSHNMLSYDKHFRVRNCDLFYYNCANDIDNGEKTKAITNITNGKITIINTYRNDLHSAIKNLKHNTANMDKSDIDAYINMFKSYYKTTNRYLSYGFKLDDEHDHFKEFIFSHIAKDKVYSCCANGALYYKLNYGKDKTIVCQCDISGKKCKKSYKYETIFKSITIKMYANDVTFIHKKMK